MSFLIKFIVLSILNVMLSTFKSIITIKGGKAVSALVNGGYFAFYNVMIIYTVADFPLWQKCIITFFANVIGVFIVKLIEDKTRKQKLWKIEFAVKQAQKDEVEDILKNLEDIEYYAVVSNNSVVFNVFSDNKAESKSVKTALKAYCPKYFVSETKCFE